MLGIILASYIGGGALLMAVAQPLVERRVKPNNWYGVRTPKTKSNEDIWYEANEYGGRVLCQLGYGMMAATIVLLPLAWLLSRAIGIQLASSCYGLTCALILLGATLWMAAKILKRVGEL